jgi:hypothetical protein
MGSSSAAALALAAALAQYLVAERIGRRAWRLVLGYHAEQGPYRESKIVVRHGDRAPGAVRFAAFTCILCGQMFVPVAIAVVDALEGYFGRLRVEAGLGAALGIVSLVVAGALWATGYALLLRTDRRRGLARFAQRAAIVLNAFILGAYPLWVHMGAPHRTNIFIAGTLLYALLSLSQAALLGRALAIDTQESLVRTPVAPQLPRWLVRLLQRKRARAAS